MTGMKWEPQAAAEAAAAEETAAVAAAAKGRASFLQDGWNLGLVNMDGNALRSIRSNYV
jgi:hypothetical protein